MNSETKPPRIDDPDGRRRFVPHGVPGLVSVEISDTQSHLAIDPEELARQVRATLASEGVARASISLAVVDDATIRAINLRHLDHDWPTVVISFVLSDADDPELSGELVVSAETAATTARQAGVPPRDELALYMVHGLLHLCGYDDEADEARGLMRRREGEILAELGLTNTFTAAGLPEDADGVGRGEREAARWPV